MDDETVNLLAKVRFKSQNGKLKLSNRMLSTLRTLSQLHVDFLLESKHFPNFKPDKQRRKLFLKQSFHMTFTVLFLICYVVALFVFQVNQPVNRDGKRTFDIVGIGLVLSLGLNFFQVFKDLAKIARWRILSSGFFEVPEIILILKAESLMNVFRLMIRPFAKSLISLICLVWLLICLGAQILITVLPLFASLKSGYDSNGTTISQGYVHVPMLKCFYRSNIPDCDQDQEAFDSTIAHTYGGQKITDENCRYQTAEEISQGPQTCRYFIRNDRLEFAVRYADSNPADLNNAYPYFGAKRIVTIAATNCNAYRTGEPDKANDLDSINSVFVWHFKNSTGMYTIDVARVLLARHSTTYIWNGTHLPPSETLQVCGRRCVVLYALRDMDRGSNQEFSIFQCHINISPMFNAKDPAHELPDGVARTAAASIALSGRSGTDTQWREAQLYQDGAEWAAKLDDSPEQVGSLMAEFAATSLATMAQRNPMTLIPGSLPTLGYQTEIEWKTTSALAVTIAGFHFLMVLLILWLARPVIVMDDGYLFREVLLKGMMDTVSDGHELQPQPKNAPERQSNSIIRVGAGDGAENQAVESAAKGTGKVEELKPLLNASSLPGVQSLSDGRAWANDRSHENEEQDSSKEATENDAMETHDQVWSEMTVQEVV